MNDDRALAFFHAAVANSPWSAFRRCAYCGWHCYGLTCSSHRDLLLLDVNYREARIR